MLINESMQAPVLVFVKILRAALVLLRSFVEGLPVRLAAAVRLADVANAVELVAAFHKLPLVDYRVPFTVVGLPPGGGGGGGGSGAVAAAAAAAAAVSVVAKAASRSP